MAKTIKYLQLSVAGVFAVGSVAIAQSAYSAVLDDVFDRIFGKGPNPYRQCAETLARAKVAPTEAAAACSNAVRPEDLGVCVRRMGEVKVAGPDALGVCRQVRRPVEAATCVVDISRKATQTAFADVLSACRQSLLPERFSQCVVGINQELKLTTRQAIDSCISAVDTPRDVLPTFIPGATVPPATVPAPTTPSVPTPTTNPGSTPPPPSGTELPQRF
jgi:hypothetical protein